MNTKRPYRPKVLDAKRQEPLMVGVFPVPLVDKEMLEKMGAKKAERSID